MDNNLITAEFKQAVVDVIQKQLLHEWNIFVMNLPHGRCPYDVSITANNGLGVTYSLSITLCMHSEDWSSMPQIEIVLIRIIDNVSIGLVDFSFVTMTPTTLPEDITSQLCIAISNAFNVAGFPAMCELW